MLLQVAGGDGTAGWLLGVVSDLKLAHPPPIATVPLGTGNNLPFSFGWVRLYPLLTPKLCLQSNDERGEVIIVPLNLILSYFFIYCLLALALELQSH